MKIALIDLVHGTRGVNSITVPLGMGFLVTYLKKNLPDQQFDIKIFKDPEEALDGVNSASWVPDIVGISQYCWNSHLNLYFAELARKNYPKCLVVAGGPNIDTSPKSREEFLKKNKFIDLVVTHDGEIPFLEIVKRYLNGESAVDLRKNPPAGVFALYPDTLTYSALNIQPPRLISINVFGPVYASGVFDKFLDAGYYPILETVRGCPFTCAYCHASDSYYSKLIFLSPEIFRQEMEYLGKRLANRPDIVLYFANSNMGFFDEDMKMAEIVRETQKKYGWPKYINLSTGKDPEKLLKMLSIVDFEPGIALQTLTLEVLQNIGRRNIPLEDYVDFQKKVLKQRGDTTATELILCLPGETKKSFLETLGKVINSGVQTVVVFTLLKLVGTKIATEDYIKKFRYLVKYRLLPRQFSLINGKKIFETEEAIVATKDMSFVDYLDLRGLCFVVGTIFSSAEFLPLKKLLLEFQVDLFQWVLNIHNSIKNYPILREYYDDFMTETREELFDSREDLVRFYEQEENFNDLLKGNKGDNLLRKYKFRLLSENFSQCLALALEEAKKLLENSEDKNMAAGVLKDLELFLSPRDLRSFFDKSGAETAKEVQLEYNVPDWLRSDDLSHPRGLRELRGIFKYAVALTLEQKKLFDKLNGAYGDSDLSWQMAYRDGYTKDLWPVWTQL